MRHVAIPPEPPSLSDDRTQRERRLVSDFYAHWDGRAKFDGKKFQAYKNEDVRDRLEAVFGGKCAYCESVYAATQPVAIEHFRPKGEVTINKVRTPPGYHWLASQWTNLLPSCTDCNSARGQKIPGEKDPRVVGKANAFPLADESTRAKVEGDEVHEARLLLHPYFDEPEKHLVFRWDKGDFGDGWVEPAIIDDEPSPMGTATIEVCALRRSRLVANRRERLVELLAHLESVVEAFENVTRHPDDERFVAQFERRLRDVQPFVADFAPYSVMCRQVVAAYQRRLFTATPR
ncbi:hypothetical protein ACQB6R_05480 [Propionibacteriaceae bacterium G1746]|uniref:hypothetical protein n=1 Tax=Aestuariimicrobium sp. G57 TaxID=3418485 RepID=UPI003C215E78